MIVHLYCICLIMYISYHLSQMQSVMNCLSVLHRVHELLHLQYHFLFVNSHSPFYCFCKVFPRFYSFLTSKAKVANWCVSFQHHGYLLHPIISNRINCQLINKSHNCIIYFNLVTLPHTIQTKDSQCALHFQCLTQCFCPFSTNWIVCEFMHAYCFSESFYD